METNTKYLVELINNKWITLINSTIKKALGVDVYFRAEDMRGYCYLEDRIKTDVDKKMRGNKMLRHLFKEANLYGYAYLYTEEHCITISINVSYKHPDNGSNGHGLGCIYIDTEKGTAKFRP